MPQDGSENVQQRAQPISSSSNQNQASCSISGYQLDKLNGHKNFSAWKFNIKNLLIIDGLWKCVTGEDVDPARDERALARICLSVNSTCHQYVLKATTSKEAWNSLTHVFEDSGLARKVMLLRKLHRIELAAYATMSEYIEATMMLVQQLADISKVIDDEEVAEILLSGLPREYEALVSNLETVCMTTTLSSEVVRSRLLQEETRKNGNGLIQHEEKAFVSKTKIVKKCAFCGKLGHTKNRCFRLKKMKNEEQAASGLHASAFLATDGQWVLDSGCSQHMCNNKFAFSHIEESSQDCLNKCVPCLEGKMALKPFPSATSNRASQPLQLVHTDVCDPLPVESWGGARYILTFTDDFIRKTFGYLMRNKSEETLNTTALGVSTRTTPSRRPLLKRFVSV